MCPAAVASPRPHRKRHLNWGKVSPEAGSPSQALRASSPKVGALGKGGKSPRNAFGSFAAAERKDSKPETLRTAKASHFGRGGIASAMTERARPLPWPLGPSSAGAHGGKRARPAEGTIPVARNIFLQNCIKVLDRHCGVW